MEPFGPQLQLMLRFLAGNIQNSGKFTQFAANLQHQGGLADTGRTAHQHQRAFDGPAAQNPIQLPHASGKADFLIGREIRHRAGAAARQPHTGGAALSHALWQLRLLHNGVPRAAGRTFPRPLRRLVAALCTVKQSLCFHIGSSPAAHCRYPAAMVTASVI